MGKLFKRSNKRNLERYVILTTDEEKNTGHYTAYLLQGSRELLMDDPDNDYMEKRIVNMVQLTVANYIELHAGDFINCAVFTSEDIDSFQNQAKAKNKISPETMRIRLRDVTHSLVSSPNSYDDAQQWQTTIGFILR